jgi:hypothetical protein
MKPLVLIFLIFLTHCSHSSTQPQPPLSNLTPEKTKITCSQNKDIRFLEIRPLQEKGCSLFYTKFNTEKSIAQATAEKKYCEDVGHKIVQNLTQSGFSCE